MGKKRCNPICWGLHEPTRLRRPSPPAVTALGRGWTDDCGPAGAAGADASTRDIRVEDRWDRIQKVGETWFLMVSHGFLSSLESRDSKF